MFLLQVNIVPGSDRMVWTPRGKRVPGRPKLRAVVTHLPTGRRWHFKSRRAGMMAQRTLAAAVASGELSILPTQPIDWDVPLTPADEVAMGCPTLG